MPAIIYKNKDKKRVPSVTTVLKNLGENKGALMHWAWKEGSEGRDYRDSRNQAADIGTYSHLWISADIKGEPFDIDKIDCSDEQRASVQSCYEAWRVWRDSVKFEMVASEESLVSEEHQYGGTLDICMAMGTHAVMDLKTAKGAYLDMLIQISAYRQLWNENHPDQRIDCGYLLLLGKQEGSFKYNYYTQKQMDAGFAAFKLLRDLHPMVPKLKAMV
jgi:hypothetical protein